MKKIAGFLFLCLVGTVYADIYSGDKIEGYWFGDALKDKTAGMVICDNTYGLAYLGLYSEKKIPNFKRASACNLAISMDKDGKAMLQVVDPSNGKMYYLDLLELAKKNQN